MAANEYYSAHSEESQQTYQSYRPQPQNVTAYQTQASSLHPSQRPDPSPVSPFETPFDDHVYPTGHPASRMNSENSLGPETRFYGKQGQGGSESSFADDIPLRDHPGKPGFLNESTDHVYDAPVAPLRLMEEGRSKRRSGLGFLKAPTKRIAWVVYTLTLIQVAVFIAEIAKNGEHLL